MLRHPKNYWAATVLYFCSAASITRQSNARRFIALLNSVQSTSSLYQFFAMRMNIILKNAQVQEEIQFKTYLSSFSAGLLSRTRMGVLWYSN